MGSVTTGWGFGFARRVAMSLGAVGHDGSARVFWVGVSGSRAKRASKTTGYSVTSDFTLRFGVLTYRRMFGQASFYPNLDGRGREF